VIISSSAAQMRIGKPEFEASDQTPGDLQDLVSQGAEWPRLLLYSKLLQPPPLRGVELCRGALC
jgi:hypothetical protein